jgi:hypothetical protein
MLAVPTEGFIAVMVTDSLSVDLAAEPAPEARQRSFTGLPELPPPSALRSYRLLFRVLPPYACRPPQHVRGSDISPGPILGGKSAGITSFHGNLRNCDLTLRLRELTVPPISFTFPTMKLVRKRLCDTGH